MITREKHPPNLEMPFGSLNGFITPTERFYVRCHFPVPNIDEREWRLKIEGLVTHPCEVSLDELRELPPHTITATIECAGNSRVFLVPKVKGVQWELGAVGNAEWTGVSLRDVLLAAGLQSDAKEVVLEGADHGSIAEPPRPTGEIHFARSLPIEKAIADVLLVFEMNGRPLSSTHGFPVRAVVPGWYGMASVKWLERIVVTDQPFNGYYQTVDYAFWRRTDSGPALTPLSETQVKAEIAWPENSEVIARHADYVVHGAAWSGNAAVRKVELTTDGGASWVEANFTTEELPNGWRLWESTWRPDRPGKYTLMARATDSRGRIQPLERNADASTYMIHHCLPIEVEVL